LFSTKEEKIKNAICFFALEHEKLAREPLGLNSLRKYLASLGYRSFEMSRRPALGLLRGRLGRRHVIVDIDGKQTKLKGDCFSLVPYHGTYVVEAAGSPDLNYFSPFELLGMKRTVEIGAAGLERRVDSGLDIREARGRRMWVGEKAEDEAIHEPPTKHKEVCDMSGLNMLIQRYTKQLEELETRMAEVKRKLEITMEASRLLQEEGLSEDGPRVPFVENG
jgi:hypothetical protein